MHLLGRMLAFDPSRRISAEEALSHEYFAALESSAVSELGELSLQNLILLQVLAHLQPIVHLPMHNGLVSSPGTCCPSYAQRGLNSLLHHADKVTVSTVLKCDCKSAAAASPH